MRTLLRSSLALSVVLAAGCEDSIGPNPVVPEEAPILAIWDGAHGGNQNFFFLSPLVKAPNHSGVFNAEIAPTVEICASTASSTACESVHARYTMTAGPEGVTVRVNATDEHYSVNWHTDRTGATAGHTYRVSVWDGTSLLGYADVAIAGNGKAAKSATNNETIGLVDGRTLPIKFRIEKGTGIAPPVGPTVWEFSTCGATGAFGPSQDLCDEEYRGKSLEGISVAAGIQTWIVPVSGTYRITAVGARGASGDAERSGGRGAQITGEFALTAGAVLRVAVGQMGERSDWNGGGGGGTFVVDSSNDPLVVAGGGGGTRSNVGQDGCDASTQPYGVSGSSINMTSSCAIKNSGLAQGGVLSGVGTGSGGGGFAGTGNGANDLAYGATAGQGGRSWLNGLAGGVPAGCDPAPGGFGGGGSGNGCPGGGGGGGYSGGDGGNIAGGGGSYNGGANPSVVGGVGTGHGSVRIERISP